MRSILNFMPLHFGVFDRVPVVVYDELCRDPDGVMSALAQKIDIQITTKSAIFFAGPQPCRARRCRRWLRSDRRVAGCVDVGGGRRSGENRLHLRSRGLCQSLTHRVESRYGPASCSGVSRARTDRNCPHEAVFCRRLSADRNDTASPRPRDALGGLLRRRDPGLPARCRPSAQRTPSNGSRASIGRWSDSRSRASPSSSSCRP